MEFKYFDIKDVIKYTEIDDSILMNYQSTFGYFGNSLEDIDEKITYDVNNNMFINKHMLLCVHHYLDSHDKLFLADDELRSSYEYFLPISKVKIPKNRYDTFELKWHYRPCEHIDDFRIMLEDLDKGPGIIGVPLRLYDKESKMVILTAITAITNKPDQFDCLTVTLGNGRTYTPDELFNRFEILHKDDSKKNQPMGKRTDYSVWESIWRKIWAVD